MQTDFENYFNKSVSENIRDQNYKMLLNDELHLCETQQIVYDALVDGKKTDKEIAIFSGLPLSSVCGRRNELVKIGIVEAVGTKLMPDYKNCMHPNTLWGLTVGGFSIER